MVLKCLMNHFEKSFLFILPILQFFRPSCGTRRLAVVMSVWTVATVMPQRRCSNSLCLALAGHVQHISIPQCLAVKFCGISKWPRNTVWCGLIIKRLLSSENGNCIFLSCINHDTSRKRCVQLLWNDPARTHWRKTWAHMQHIPMESFVLGTLNCSTQNRTDSICIDIRTGID